MIYLIIGGNNTLITSDGGPYSPVAGGGSRHAGLGEGEGPRAALQRLQAQDKKHGVSQVTSTPSISAATCPCAA